MPIYYSVDQPGFYTMLANICRAKMHVYVVQHNTVECLHCQPGHILLDWASTYFCCFHFAVSIQKGTGMYRQTDK